MLRIAGIGARATPEAICKEMTQIGVWCRKNNHWITSGHASGADYAFEMGAREKTIIYLPWEGYNKELPILGNAIVLAMTSALRELVNKLHPAVDKLSTSAFNLHARNGAQILGVNLDKPVDVVICWRNKSGGTDQAIRIANHYKIPVWNMNSEQYNTASKVIDALHLLRQSKERQFTEFSHSWN